MKVATFVDIYTAYETYRRTFQDNRFVSYERSQFLNCHSSVNHQNAPSLIHKEHHEDVE